MKHWLLLTTPAVLLLTGCGPDMMSLHPLYNEDDVILEDALPGQWVHFDGERKETWRFERVDGRNSYKLMVEGDDKPIECHLVRLSNYLFLDASSLDAGDTGVRGHMFLRVELDGDTLRLASIDDKWLRGKLEKENALAHERVRGGRQAKLVIRAATVDLQAFLVRHASDAEAFPEWTGFHRTAPTTHREVVP